MASNIVPMTSPAPTEDATYTYDEFPGTTSQQGVNVRTPKAPDLVIESFWFFICAFGFVANLAMLVRLAMKRQAARNTVNVFVCNQTILDLVATFVLVLKHSLLVSGYLIDLSANSTEAVPSQHPRSIIVTFSPTRATCQISS